MLSLNQSDCSKEQSKFAGPGLHQHRNQNQSDVLTRMVRDQRQSPNAQHAKRNDLDNNHLKSPVVPRRRLILNCFGIVSRARRTGFIHAGVTAAPASGGSRGGGPCPHSPTKLGFGFNRSVPARLLFFPEAPAGNFNQFLRISAPSLSGGANDFLQTVEAQKCLAVGC